jgi:4-amino-4-deoxy-L-arabinose transferase-like glycosyltransferase
MESRPDQTRKISRRDMIGLLLCLLLGFALRCYTFDQKSLWLDEVYTFEASRDALQGQINFYQENPTYLHPPLFFVLTHLFYPFSKPERDLRIIPLIFGTLSIPMLFFLVKQFSPDIALPCTLSLTFMVYHVSLSQDGRAYSFLLFLGMMSAFFLMRYLKTANRAYLPLTAFAFSILFLTSYSSIPFIVFSQILWVYERKERSRKKAIASFFILTGCTLVFILPWLLFVAFNYTGKPLLDPIHMDAPGSLSKVLYGVLSDWAIYSPLSIVSALLLALYPILSKERLKAQALLALFVLPIIGLYTFCKLVSVPHFIASRYFINFLPFFLILLYSSLSSVELRFPAITRRARPSLLFLIFFIALNMVTLPFYYSSEKMNFRGLATYLRKNLQEGDKIFVMTTALMPGILHYFEASPTGRHHRAEPIPGPEKNAGYQIPFYYGGKKFSLIYSSTCCKQFVPDRNRLWLVVFKWKAKQMEGKTPAVLKGFFDGSFLNHDHFPADGSIYLFLWDPKSPGEKGLDLPIE